MSRLARLIPIVALVDTNCNPEEVDYPIPANDDAIRAVKLLAGKIADAALEGVTLRQSAFHLAEAPVVQARRVDMAARDTRSRALRDRDAEVQRPQCVAGIIEWDVN